MGGALDQFSAQFAPLSNALAGDIASRRYAKMPDEDNGSPEPSGSPAPAAAPTGAPATVQLSSEQLRARLAEERAKGAEAFAKEFGFSKLDEAKAAFAALKEAERAKLSAEEKAAARIKELEAYEQRSKAYEQIISGVVEEQFSALPESARAAIDAIANGDPAERLKLMRVIRASQGAAAPQPAAPPAPQPAPANTSPAPAPSPSAPRTKFDEWEAVKRKHPIAADIFYQTHQREIEASRPSPA